MAESALQGPARYLAEHPAAWAASMAGAGTAAGVFAARSVRCRGSRRGMWAALSVLEIAILAGIFTLPRSTQRARGSTD